MSNNNNIQLNLSEDELDNILSYLNDIKNLTSTILDIEEQDDRENLFIGNMYEFTDKLIATLESKTDRTGVKYH